MKITKRLVLLSALVASANAKPATGLLARYDFDQDGGSILIDKSGHGYNGTIKGNPVSMPGISGKSLDFDGDGDYVALPNDSAFKLDRFTIVTWIKPRSMAGIEKTIYSNYLSTASPELKTSGTIFRLRNGSLECTSAGAPANGDWFIQWGTAPAMDQRWHQVATTLDGTTQRLYLDGVMVSEQAYAGTIPHDGTTPLIGADLGNWVGEGYFDGGIDEMSIYDSALTAKDIAAAYSVFVRKPVLGLVARYDFDQDSGSTLIDKSGHGFNGTIKGNPVSMPGISGKSLDFDGNGDYVALPKDTAFQLDRFTIMAWVKPRTMAGTEKTIYSNLLSSGNPDLLSAGSIFRFRDGLLESTSARAPVNGNWFIQQKAVPLTDGPWHLVTTTLDGSIQRIYVDGVEISAAAFSGSIAHGGTTPLIGADLGNWVGPGYFDGGIDEMSIYDSALTAKDIAAAYSALVPVPVTPAKTLIAHYDFDQGSGSVLADKSGHGHNGAITGAQWTDGVKGGALRFDGVKDRVLIPFASDLNTPEFTLMAWIRTDEKTHDQALIDRVSPGGDAWNYRLMIPSRIHQIEGHDVPPGVVQSDVRDGFTSRWDYIALGQTKVTLGKWRQVVATFKDRVFKIYVDGVLDGTKNVTIDAMTSTTQPLLLGDCAYTPIEFHFRGDMDEVSLYNYALDADQIAEMAAAFAFQSPEVNLGMKSHFGNPGDTVWAPLYLTNFGKATLSAAQFTLQFDTSVVSLLDVKADSGLASDWPLFNWNPAQKDLVPVALGGAAVPLGYDEGELVRFKFLIRADATPGSSTALDVANARLDEDGNINVTNVPGKITVSKPKVLYGDVTGNGEVNLFDAQKILLHVVGSLPLPDSTVPDFTTEIADVSGNGEVTSYDAALVFQYSLGLIDKFPVESPAAKTVLAKHSAPALGKTAAGAVSGAALNANSSLVLDAPVHLDGDVYRYRLEGAGLQGLLSGELAFDLSDSIVSVKRVTSGVPGARLSQRFNPSSGRLVIVLATNNDLDGNRVDFLDIEAQHKSGVTAGGMRLVSAYLDEGRFTGAGIVSQPLAITYPRPDGKNRARSFLSVAGMNLVIGAEAGRPLRIEAFDPRGRKALSRVWSAAPATVKLPLAELPRGMIWLRVSADGVASVHRFANLR